jgi:hypothetical protein
MAKAGTYEVCQRVDGGIMKVRVKDSWNITDGEEEKN